MADDPKQLGGWVPLVYGVAQVSLLGLVVWAPLTLSAFATYVLAGREDDRLLRALLLLVVATVLAGAFILFLQSFIGNWFLD
ncbi:MAG: hypothetical protein DHS20C16_11960 [Phycisphaerae bacterium]|nr:MAG: hypothetical protein DHS20C16_11960 [Phycisphaerae bacterium]